jgi:hypothetical protein
LKVKILAVPRIRLKKMVLSTSQYTSSIHKYEAACPLLNIHTTVAALKAV